MQGVHVVNSLREKASSARSDSIDDSYLLEVGNRLSAEKQLVRKLDMRILPIIATIFMMNYIDRIAISSARLQGLEKDLHLTEIQYNVALAILFLSYAPAQVPSNMILNKIARPSLYIGICTVLWGLSSLSVGTTTSFSGLLACRFFIGLPEASFYPGATYLLSRWYTRKELALRAATLSSGFIVSNAIGSLLAAGILRNLEDKLGIRAWRWLFFIEGAITIFIGFQAMWLLPDYPYNTRWLSAAERRLARARLAEDAAEADEDASVDTPLQGLKLALQDPKVHLFALMAFTHVLGLSFANFFPTLTATLGYSTTITLLVAAPPWILAAIICVGNAWDADKTGERFWHITFWWWVTVLGYVISLSTMSTPGRFLSLFLLASGNAGAALSLAWLSNTIPRPPSKRAASIGIVNGVGNLGNLVGAFTWRVEWSPQYRPSMLIGMSSMLLSILLAFVARMILIRENRLLDEDEQRAMKMANQERVEQAARLEGITLAEAIEKKRRFRYLY